MLRQALLLASRSDVLRRVASDAPLTRGVAARFVAGETLDDALGVVEELNERGLVATLDHLGEAVHDGRLAVAAADAYIEALDRLESDRLDSSISVKLTQLGLDVSPDLCFEQVRRVCARAAEAARHVTVDMEGSDHTQATLDLLDRLLDDGFTDVGCALQSYLHRTVEDTRRLTARGASLRLCKGAYAEGEDIAYQDDSDISSSYLRAAEIVLRSGVYARFATHDDRLISRVRNLAVRHQVPVEAYEFQMLYGVREPLQRDLLDAGHRVRIYVPYGSEWYPYLVRRLAERPANLTFFLRALAGRRAN